jgi:hypothetical protein
MPKPREEPDMTKHPQEQPEADDTEKFAHAGTDKDQPQAAPSSRVPAKDDREGDKEEGPPSKR